MKHSNVNSLDYGNWTRKKIIVIFGLISLVFLALTYFSLFFLIGAVSCLITFIYLVYTYYRFSPRGGNLQNKIRDQVFINLDWQGNGSLLDVGY